MTKFKQNTIAIVYDFDGTLSPQPMQEYTILPELGVSGEDFWQQCSVEAREYKADKMLTYMRKLVEEINKNDIKIGRNELQAMGKKIQYFAGVETWFAFINKYIKQRSNNKVNIKHYIISAGLKEILNGISIGDEFSNIFACEYYFDSYDKAQFPTIVINDTSKTQYLFRINKGIEDINKSINHHMPKADRPIPFSNIIYIGDGQTDVPCMALTKENGGFAIAVHKPHHTDTKKICRELLRDNRIDYFAPADYRKDSKLCQRIQLILDNIITNIALEKDKHSFKNKEKLS